MADGSGVIEGKRFERIDRTSEDMLLCAKIRPPGDGCCVCSHGVYRCGWSSRRVVKEGRRRRGIETRERLQLKENSVVSMAIEDQ